METLINIILQVSEVLIGIVIGYCWAEIEQIKTKRRISEKLSSEIDSQLKEGITLQNLNARAEKLKFNEGVLYALEELKK